MKKDNLIILVAFILCCSFLFVYFIRKNNPIQTKKSPVQTQTEDQKQLSASQVEKIQNLIDKQNEKLSKIKELEKDIATYKEIFKERKLVNPLEKAYKENPSLQIPEVDIPDIKIEELNTSNYAQAVEDLENARIPLTLTCDILQGQRGVYKQILIKTQITPIPYKEGPFGINQNYIPFIKKLINLKKEKEISAFTDEEIYEAAEPYKILDINRMHTLPLITTITLQNGDEIYLYEDKIRAPFKDKKFVVIYFYFNGNTTCVAPVPEDYEDCQKIGGTDPVADTYHPDMKTFKLPKNIFD